MEDPEVGKCMCPSWCLFRHETRSRKQCQRLLLKQPHVPRTASLTIHFAFGDTPLAELLEQHCNAFGADCAWIIWRLRGAHSCNVEAMAIDHAGTHVLPNLSFSQDDLSDASLLGASVAKHLKARFPDINWPTLLPVGSNTCFAIFVVK